MENYPKEIVKAYEEWMEKAVDSPFNGLVNDNYKNAKRAERTAGNKFEKLCIQAGLNYLKVASDLIGSQTIKIN